MKDFILASQAMLKTFFHIIRWPNLLMVGLIQGMVYTRLLDRTLSALPYPDFVLLAVVTMIIGAAGYVINDYYDSHTDSINRPQGWIAGNRWSLRKTGWVFVLLTVAGAILAVIVAVRLHLTGLLLLYPLAIAGMWLYSYTLKCRPVIGNIWVSLFCAGVIVIVAAPDLVGGNMQVVKSAFRVYVVFAFLSTWYREVVKDLEDIRGDTAAGCMTFVVRYGAPKGKVLAIIPGALLLCGLVWWGILQQGLVARLLLAGLFTAITVSIYMIRWAEDREHFRRVSLMIKWVMVVGTMVLMVV